MDTKQQRDTAATFQAALARRGNLPVPSAEVARHLVGRKKDAESFILPLDRIRVDADQVRQRGKGPDDPETMELARSIDALGLANPISVRWLQAEDVYEIVSGERRYTAMRILRRADIPVRVVDVPADQVLWLQLAENLHRAALHPLDLAFAVREAMDGGMSLADVAGRLHKSASWVQKALTVARELTGAAADVLPGKGMETLYEVAKVPPGEQEGVAHRVLDLNLREARKVVAEVTKKYPGRQARNGRPPAEASYSRTFEAANGIKVTLQSTQANPALEDLVAALVEVQKTFGAESHSVEAA